MVRGDTNHGLGWPFRPTKDYFTELLILIFTKIDSLNSVTYRRRCVPFRRHSSGKNVNHYVIGCNAIGQLSPSSNGYYFNKHYGPISLNCTYIN